MFGMDKHITQEDMIEKKEIRKGFESKEKWQNQRQGKTSRIASSQRIVIMEILREKVAF